MSTATSVNRIVVVGANGGIGKHAVEQALKRGYNVVAILRDPDKLNLRHTKLTVQKADVMKPETLAGILEKGDVVISTIGKNSTKETTLYSQGTKHVIQAMEQAGVSRLFVTSASGLNVNPTHNLFIRWATRNILQRILQHPYADQARMEGIVKASDLDWTIMRPPRLIDSARTGKYRVAINAVVDNGLRIARADVADFMLRNIDNEDTLRATVEVGY